MVAHSPPSVIVVVGAGPRGVGFLERLAASVPELLPDRPVEVHLVDPFPPGPGRVWRHAQSELLRMNSMAEDVTMFTDESVACEGPIVPGPSMAQWGADAADDPELAALTGGTFPTRRLASRYLTWVFERVRADAPDSVRVIVHRDRVTGITGPPDGRQCVRLAEGPALLADVVVLALGHLDAQPAGDVGELAGFADRHGLYYLPPAYTADVDLAGVPAGQPVLVRGLGLAFIDLMVLLTEGRGGTFEPAADGTLEYRPSGREPVLYVGSRRGVPYHAKTTYRLAAGRPPLPHFFGPERVAELIALDRPLDFFDDVWPLAAKEIGWAYYRELGLAHPERMTVPWAEFDRDFAALDWFSPGRSELVAATVPDPADRLEFDALDRPLAGRRFATPAAVQEHVREYVAADLARRSDPAFSADLGAFFALLSVWGQLPPIVAAGRLTARSRLRGLEGWWQGFFSYFASGPPGDRLDQLLALSRAGVVRFLGADMWLRADESLGRFVAGSASVDGEVVAAALIEARLPRATVQDTADGLLRALHDTRDVIAEILPAEPIGLDTGLVRASGKDGRVLDAAGTPHRRRFALGPFTTVRTAAAFARPGTNAPAFRYNDAAARAVLRLLAESPARAELDRSRVPS